jgi:hypothetical protein
MDLALSELDIFGAPISQGCALGYHIRPLQGQSLAELKGMT